MRALHHAFRLPTGVSIAFVVMLLLFGDSRTALAAPATPALASDARVANITLTNVRDVSFTVSWTTDVASLGAVNYGTSGALGLTANDDRGATVSSTTHHVTLSGLNPGTLYYFDVVSDGTIDNNGGSHYAVTTGPTLALPGSDTVYGQVFKSDGITPAAGSIVYLTLSDNNGAGSAGVSALMSALVDASGYWMYNLGNTRVVDLSAYFVYSPIGGDNVRIVVRGGADGDTSPTTVDTASDKPVPDIHLAVCYALTTSANPSGGGNVGASPSPNCPTDESKYSAGTVVQLTATPSGNYAFSHWSGDANGASNPTSVTMTANKNVTANFALLCYTLTTSMNPSGGGSVGASPSPNCPTDASKYAAGTVVQLTATPSSNYTFSNWSGDASGASNPTSVTMSGNKSVGANFLLQCYTLTTNANPSGGGNIGASPSPNCPTDASKYAAGTVVQLTATPNSNHTFSNWSGDASGASNPTSVTMTANKNVTANFALLCYTLTTNVNPSGGGSVGASPSPNCPTDASKYAAGTVVQLTVTPNGNYTFSNWSGDAGGAPNPTSVTMNGNRSVTANFTLLCYTLTTNANPSGGGGVGASPSPNCPTDANKYAAATTVQLTATPSSNYAFSNWSGDTSGASNPTGVTMSGNRSVTANFQTDNRTWVFLPLVLK